MKNPFKDDPEEIGSKSNDNSVLLTVKMFFGGDGWSPYFTKDEWLAYGKSLRASEVSDLHKLVEGLGNGLKMEGNPTIKTDIGKRKYAYHRFYKPKASFGTKIILEGGMEQFITDYQEGKITIAFTLQELTAEAKQQ